MLVDPGRGDAVRLLLETGLAAAVLPEIVPKDDAGRQRLERPLAVLGAAGAARFSLGLGGLALREWTDAAAARQVCRRWRLSNKETERVVWLLEHRADLAGARTKPWSALQPLLVSDGIEDLLALHAAAVPAGTDDVAYCRSLLAQPREALDPPPLVTGDDLLAHGVPAGPKFRFLLQRIRDAQLDGRFTPEARR